MKTIKLMLRDRSSKYSQKKKNTLNVRIAPKKKFSNSLSTEKIALKSFIK
jgi:hypothetical protein